MWREGRQGVKAKMYIYKKPEGERLKYPPSRLLVTGKARAEKEDSISSPRRDQNHCEQAPLHQHCSPSSSLLSSLDVPSFVTDCSYFCYHYHVPWGCALVPLNRVMSLSGSGVLDPRSKSALQFQIMQLEMCFYSRLFIWLKLMSIGHRLGERRVKGHPLYIMTCAREAVPEFILMPMTLHHSSLIKI